MAILGLTHAVGHGLGSCHAERLDAATLVVHAAPRRLHVIVAERVVLVLRFAADPVAARAVRYHRWPTSSSSSSSAPPLLLVGTRDGRVYVVEDASAGALGGGGLAITRRIPPSASVCTVPGLRSLFGVLSVAATSVTLHAAVTSCLAPTVVLAVAVATAATPQLVGAPTIAPPALEGGVPTCVVLAVAATTVAAAHHRRRSASAAARGPSRIEGGVRLDAALFEGLFGRRDGAVLLQGDADGAVRWLALVPSSAAASAGGGPLRPADRLDADDAPPSPILARLGEPVLTILALPTPAHRHGGNGANDDDDEDEDDATRRSGSTTLAIVGTRGRVLLLGGFNRLNCHGAIVGDIRLRAPVDSVAIVTTAAHGGSTFVHLCGGACFATALTLSGDGGASLAAPRRCNVRPAVALVANSTSTLASVSLLLRGGRLFEWAPFAAAAGGDDAAGFTSQPLRASLASCVRTEARQTRADAANLAETARLRDLSSALRAFTALRRARGAQSFRYACTVTAPRAASAQSFDVRISLRGLPHLDASGGAWYVLARARIAASSSHSAAVCSSCFPLKAVPACAVVSRTSSSQSPSQQLGSDGGPGGRSANSIDSDVLVGYTTLRTSCAFVLPFQLTTWLVFIADNRGGSGSGGSSSSSSSSGVGSGSGKVMQRRLASAPLGVHVVDAFGLDAAAYGAPAERESSRRLRGGGGGGVTAFASNARAAPPLCSLPSLLLVLAQRNEGAARMSAAGRSAAAAAAAAPMPRKRVLPVSFVRVALRPAPGRVPLTLRDVLPSDAASSSAVAQCFGTSQRWYHQSGGDYAKAMGVVPIAGEVVVEFRANAYTAEFGIRVEFAAGLALVRRALLRRLLVWELAERSRQGGGEVDDEEEGGCMAVDDAASASATSGYAEGYEAWEKVRRQLGLVSSSVDALAQDVEAIAEEEGQRSVGGTVARWRGLVDEVYALHRTLH